MKKPLTDLAVRSLTAPPSGRIELSDSRCRGLEFRITSGGARSWSFRFRDSKSGRVTRATIGSYPEITLAHARQLADDMRRMVAAGLNPVEEKRHEREGARTKTFEALADRYLEEHARRFKKSAAADERNLCIHVLPKWGNRRYDEIQRRDVIALCEGMIAAGTATNANRVQALVSSIYSFAVDAGLVEANPCFRLRKRAVENVGRRVLTDGELCLFWHGIVKPPVSRAVGLALRIALLTAARVGEIAQAARAEFQHLDDAERAAWTLPAERAKNGRAHFVPLSPLAREIVQEAWSLAGNNPYLFPSPTTKGQPITGHALSVAMARFGARLEGNEDDVRSWLAEPPSPHDLRRTVATRLSELGTPPGDVAACLNHARRDVTGVHYDLYDRAREKRRALNSWSHRVISLVGATTGQDVGCADTSRVS